MRGDGVGPVGVRTLLVGLGLTSVAVAVSAAPAAVVVAAASGERLLRLGVLTMLWVAGAAVAWCALRLFDADAAPWLLVLGWSLTAAGVATAVWVGGGDPGRGAVVLVAVALTAAGAVVGAGSVLRRRRSRPEVAAAGGLLLISGAQAVYAADAVIGVAPSLLDTFMIGTLVLSGGMLGLGAVVIRTWELSQARIVRAERQRALARQEVERVQHRQAEMLHEARNVLLVVDGASRALECGETTLPDAERQLLAEAVRVELRILRDLTVGAGDEQPEPMAVTPVREVAERQACLLRQLGTQVTVRVEDEPVTTMAPDGLEELVLNLLLNAERHGGGEQVELFARSDRMAGRVVVTVADRGPGLAGDRKADGHGLGLLICRRLATSVGGELTLRSRAGGGAVATVDLPGALASADVPSEPGGRGGRTDGPEPRPVDVTDRRPLARSR